MESIIEYLIFGGLTFFVVVVYSKLEHCSWSSALLLGALLMWCQIFLIYISMKYLLK